MARPGVTYFEVAQAASQLHTDNQAPTIDRVRQKLGCGSNSTIAAHLKQWKAEHMPYATEVPRSTVPPLLLAQVQSLWQSLQETATAQWDEARERYQHQLEQAQRNVAQQTEALSVAARERKEATEKVEVLTQELAQLDEHHGILLRNHEALQIRFQEQQKQLDEKSSRVQDLKAQLQNVSDNLDHFREATRQQREDETLRHEGEIHRLEGQIKNLGQQLETERDRRQAILIESEKIGVRWQQRVEENKWLTQQIDEKSQDIIELKSQIKALDSQRVDATGQHQLLQAIHDQQQTRIMEIEKKLATAQERLRNSTGNSAGPERKIEELQHEQLHWEGENRRLQETVSVLEKGLPKKPLP